MVTQNINPFGLPGFGQPGDQTQNPMLASMEMMRKAWEGLASAGGFDRTLVAPGTSPAEMEKRITDLRAVENWLRMNLTMLSSTIQALEVQSATVSAMQAFVGSATGAVSPASLPPSPLDIALGIRRGGDVAPSADSSGLFGGKAPASTPPARTHSEAATATTSSSDQASDGKSAATSSADKAAAEEGSATPGIAEGAMQTWWDMLQTQFDNLASATAATLQGTEAMQDAATAAQKQAVASTRAATDAVTGSTAVKAAPAKKAPTAKKAVAKKAAKKTTKKTPTQKAADKSTTDGESATASKPATAGKTVTANKAAAKKSTTKKTAAKKSAAKKATGAGAARKP